MRSVSRSVTHALDDAAHNSRSPRWIIVDLVLPIERVIIRQTATKPANQYTHLSLSLSCVMECELRFLSSTRTLRPEPVYIGKVGLLSLSLSGVSFRVSAQHDLMVGHLGAKMAEYQARLALTVQKEHSAAQARDIHVDRV